MNSKSISRNVWALTLSLCLGVIGYSTFSAQAAEPPQAAVPPKRADGQQKGVEKQPATGEKAVGKASSKPMAGELTGKVTGVDPTAKTFTVMVQGRAVTFSAAKLGKLPRAGENIDIAFTSNPGGPPMATSATESGAKQVKKPYQHCDDHTYRNPLNSLNVCTY
ncbi:MAG: hypothetical protein ACHQ9S_10685 [Candidatus Binatia bacterium]